jgi:hypothetical protein
MTPRKGEERCDLATRRRAAVRFLIDQQLRSQMATILDARHPGDLLIEALRFCGVVALIGGVLLALLGVLGGSPDRLYETGFNFDIIDQAALYALVGAALWAGSWALRRLLGRR